MPNQHQKMLSKVKRDLRKYSKTLRMLKFILICCLVFALFSSNLKFYFQLQEAKKASANETDLIQKLQKEEQELSAQTESSSKAEVVPGELIVKMKNKGKQEELTKINTYVSNQIDSQINQIKVDEVEEIKNSELILVKSHKAKQKGQEFDKQKEALELAGQQVKSIPEETDKLRQELLKNSNVESVSYNYIFDYKNVEASDELAQHQWSLKNPGSHLAVRSNSGNYQQYTKNSLVDSDININKAWALDQTKGAKNVTVGVVDSGVDYTHPDLEKNIWINQGEVPPAILSQVDANEDGEASSEEILDFCRANDLDYNGDTYINLKDIIHPSSDFIDSVDNDSNGYTDDIIGWDFTKNNNDPYDLNGHGTHISGIIAASKNSIGIAGIAYNSKIMPLKVIAEKSTSLIASQALSYFKDKKGDIVNMSWGRARDKNDVFDPVYQKIIDNYENQIINIGVASNDGEDLHNTFPSYLEEIVTVGAIDSKDQRGQFLSGSSSNFGPGLDVMAPGVDVLSTYTSEPSSYYRSYSSFQAFFVNKDYLFMDGTSMAGPMVAGVAALIKAKDPSANTFKVKQILRNHSDDIDQAGFDRNTGYGRLNAFLALNNADGEYPVIDLDIPNYQTVDSQSNINLVKKSTVDTWDLSIRLQTENSWTKIANGNNADFPTNFTLDTSNYLKGNYYLRLQAQNNQHTSVDIQEITIENTLPDISLTKNIKNLSQQTDYQNVGSGKLKEDLEIKISYTNNTNNQISGVKITEDLPISLELIAESCNPSCAIVADNLDRSKKLVWNLGDLKAEASGEIIFRAKIVNLDFKTLSTVEAESVPAQNLASEVKISTEKAPSQTSGRLYFLSADGQAVEYDQQTKYNTNYNRTQKFKDGPIQLVLDELKNQEGQTILSGDCTFELLRRTSKYPDGILKTYTGTISNGSCQAVFPVIDQTVNYYHVVATATDGDNGQTYQESQVLVLIVGAV
jgi:subtilisin family serine protease